MFIVIIDKILVGGYGKPQNIHHRKNKITQKQEKNYDKK